MPRRGSSKPPAEPVVKPYGCDFGRNVMRGEKGIRILAPSPYKIRQEVEKKDPQTGKTVIGSDGKPVTETKEIQTGGPDHRASHGKGAVR